VRRMPWH